MQGPIMDMQTTDGIKLRMGPISKEDLASYVGPNAMHSYKSSRYLGHTFAPTIEDEYEWFDRMRSDDGVHWGLFVDESGTSKLIGGTSLNRISNKHMFRHATSGILIFDQDYWRKGIAGASHIARTHFAFRELGLGVVYSKVYHINEASRRAIESIGYVCTGTTRCEEMHAGQWLHADQFELVNPDDWAWNAWWSGGDPTAEFVAARKRTKQKLDWAKANVHFP